MNTDPPIALTEFQISMVGPYSYRRVGLLRRLWLTADLPCDVAARP